MKVKYSLRITIPAIVLVFVISALLAEHYSSKILAYKHIYEDNLNKVYLRLNYLQVVSEQYLRLGLPNDLQKIVSSFSSEPDLGYLFVTNSDDIIVSSINISDVGLNVENMRGEVNLDLDNISNIQSVVVNGDIESPIISGYTKVCYAGNQDVLRKNKCGIVYYQLDLLFHYNQISDDSYTRLYVSMTGIFASALLILITIHFLVTKKVTSLVRVMHRFRSGKRSIRITTRGMDELDYLGDSLNNLFVKISDDEDAIKDGAERLRSIFDTAVDSIITINQQGIVESFNPAAEKMFQYTKEEVIGNNVKMLMGIEHEINHDQYIANYIKTGEKKIIGTERDIQAKRKNGDIFPIELSISEMSLHNDKMFTGIIRDTTDRKRLEEALVKITKTLQAANLELKKNARGDQLTGLYNRNYFDFMLCEELRRASRRGETVSLILCDIDYFKNYNDTLGHQAGDKCLERVGAILKNHFKRAGELAARYGGEEFVIIVPDSDSRQALERAETLCQAVRDEAISHPSSLVADIVTISIGVASYQLNKNSKQPPSEELFIKSADDALYESKHNGRNQVTVGKFVKS